MRESQTEVLVVGAGPVGLWTALVLAEAGVETLVIDQENRTAARSYACALHPHTLKLLERFGMARQLLGQGRQVDKLAFFEGGDRKAEVKLEDPGGEFPFLLVLPQSALERALEQRLRQHGVAVRWNHRLAACVQEEHLVSATIERLAGTSTGYIVPHWEQVVSERATVQAQFLIGADGQNSTVRKQLGFDSEQVGLPEVFLACEFSAQFNSPGEVRVALDDSTTNALWPLGDNHFRWTFQLLKGEAAEFPQKERRAVHVDDPIADEKLRRSVRRIAQARAPWFAAEIKDISWCSDVTFERRLVKSFGTHRCWLAGDAAHQTGPVGVQSMNSGFAEGKRLAGAVQKILREQAAPELLATGYGQEQTHEWRRLLGLQGGLMPRADTDDWARRRAPRLLPCLPGCGEDLGRLSAQLKLDLGSTAQNELSLSRTL